MTHTTEFIAELIRAVNEVDLLATFEVSRRSEACASKSA
ncbi:hypothetical protein QO002_005761 [Pararhizobium capsulatum DSM 1112]|uniref:Transposase n=1 Tax=Pararhizobium capsulatum DSM 1112 TaxID=1121113 RepID=A0ABU0C1N0_9HYPH|nr:hypothetical protein [Pararhizobium capsulatum DSM 1112]